MPRFRTGLQRIFRSFSFSCFIFRGPCLVSAIVWARFFLLLLYCVSIVCTCWPVYVPENIQVWLVIRSFRHTLTLTLAYIWIVYIYFFHFVANIFSLGKTNCFLFLGYKASRVVPSMIFENFWCTYLLLALPLI